MCQSIALRPPLLVILSIWAEISHSIYSNVYLKVKQLCLEAICRDRDVAAVLPIGYMENQSYLNCGRGAAQFHPVVIVVVSPLNALDEIDTENIRLSVLSLSKALSTKINVMFVIKIRSNKLCLQLKALVN